MVRRGRCEQVEGAPGPPPSGTSGGGTCIIPRPLAAPTGQGSAPGCNVHPGPAVLQSSAAGTDVSTVAEGTGRGWDPGWMKLRRGRMGPASLSPTECGGNGISVITSEAEHLETVWTATWAPVSCSSPFAPGLPNLLGNSAEGIEMANAVGGPVRLARPGSLCFCRVLALRRF